MSTTTQLFEWAPGQVDRDADTIEHVLDPSMIEQLEGLLNRSRVQAGVVASPHEVAGQAILNSAPPMKAGT